MTKEELWESVLAQLQFKVSKANFATWLKNTKIVEKEETKITIAVPNTFSREWLSKKYNHLISEVLREVDPEIRRVEYIIEKSIPVGTLSEKRRRFSPSSLDKEDQPNFEEFRVDPQTNLNPRYVFREFVVASFNELAQASAWAVAKNPGKAYNPLLLYGGVGLGKTHLLQAIGNELSTKKAKVKYMPAGKLVSSIVSSIRNNSIEELKYQFYHLDLLIVDDVQFLAGKEKTQEEFFHIFNTLYENNKQIVLSSDRPPSAIATLEKRLKSRFEGGMVADISQPDYESRLAILESKTRGLKNSEEILSYVATNIQHNIRELEGAINRIQAYQKLHSDSLTISQVKILLKDLTGGPRKVTTPKKIFSSVASFYSLNSDQLFAPTRRREIAWARQVAMYFLRKELRKSFPNIGNIFGGKDHTTALYAFNKVEKQVEKDEQIAEEINLIKQRIYAE
jgi:chromosomal replication initiator protein